MSNKKRAGSDLYIALLFIGLGLYLYTLAGQK